MKIPLNMEKDKEKEEIAKSYYAQIPGSFLTDKSVSAEAKVLYGTYHLHCPKKTQENLAEGKTRTYIGQKALSKELGCSVLSIKRWQKKLEKSGWITVERRLSRFGTNIITLHATPVKPSRRGQTNREEGNK